VSEGATRRSWRLQFTIAQALLAMVPIAMVVGYAVNDGFGVAIMFAVLVSLAWKAVRTLRGWSMLTLWQHIYGCVSVGVLAMLLLGFVVGIAKSPSSVRERNVRHLQRVLSGDSRFSSVQVQHKQMKGVFLRIYGRVESDCELDALRETVLGYEWPEMNGINWHVTVGSPAHVYDRWDSELFDHGENKGRQ
jgi:hypothetical protein